MTVDFYCHRSFEESQGYNHSELLSNLREDTFEAGKWPIFQAHALAYFQIIGRFDPKPRSHGALDCRDLTLVDWGRGFADAHEVQNSWNRQNGQSADRIDVTEYIARKERQIPGLKTIRPSPATLVQRQELLKAFAADSGRDAFLTL